MERTIKSPTLESGARIHSRVGESIRYDYTPLLSLCNSNSTIFYIDRIHRHLINSHHYLINSHHYLINPHRDLINSHRHLINSHRHLMSAENILKGVEKC